MKKIITTVIILIAATVQSVSAQEFATSYFLDNNVYSYRINPAISGEKGFVGLAISNINLSFGSNTGISSLLYPGPSGGLVTYLHPSVSADQAISNLPKNLRLDQTLNENLLAVGFWAGNAYHNVEFNLKEDIFAGLPRDLFELAKVGSSAIPYDISQTNMSIKSYAEIAYGYSRKINEQISVGGRVKFLMGLAAADVGMDKGLLSVNADGVSYNMSAKLRLSSNMLEMGVNPDDPRYFSFSTLNMSLNEIKPCGWGGAVDLGVTYKPIEGLTTSFSVLDLGGIGWKYNIVGVSTGSDTFTGATIKSDGTIGEDLDKFVKNLESIAQFQRVEGGESEFSMLACTMNLGARYKMPFYERLSAGLLLSYKIDKYNPCFGARLGATVTPLDWISVTGNYGINSYCWTYGAALSINAATINFILGYEGYSGKVANIGFSEALSPLVTPLNSFTNMVKLGINITFGKRHNDFRPVGKKA